MSFWTDIFTGGVVSKGMDMLDDAVLTDQEVLGYKAKLLGLYEPYKLVQRLLALLVTISYLGLHVLYSLADFWLVINGHERVCEGLITDNNATMGQGWGWIMIWYFSGGMVEGGIKAFRGVIKK